MTKGRAYDDKYNAMQNTYLGCRRRLLLGVKEDAIGFVSGIDYNIL
jgi:hypothetical protein